MAARPGKALARRGPCCATSAANVRCISERHDDKQGSSWRVPSDFHEPIRQDAVLLKRAASNGAARAFLEYLRSPEARALLRGYGYEAD